MNIELDTITEHLAQDLISSNIQDFEALKVKIKMALRMSLPEPVKNNKGLRTQYDNLLIAHEKQKIKFKKHNILNSIGYSIMKEKLKDVLTLEEQAELFAEIEMAEARAGVRDVYHSKEKILKRLKANNR